GAAAGLDSAPIAVPAVLPAGLTSRLPVPHPMSITWSLGLTPQARRRTWWYSRSSASESNRVTLLVAHRAEWRRHRFIMIGLARAVRLHVVHRGYHPSFSRRSHVCI